MPMHEILKLYNAQQRAADYHSSPVLQPGVSECVSSQGHGRETGSRSVAQGLPEGKQMPFQITGTATSLVHVIQEPSWDRGEASSSKVTLLKTEFAAELRGGLTITSNNRS